MFLMKIIGDVFEIIGGRRSPPKAHSALKHPFDAGIHLGFVDELSPICLFNPFANARTEAITSW
jgi:hypothetical protein